VTLGIHANRITPVPGDVAHDAAEIASFERLGPHGEKDLSYLTGMSRIYSARVRGGVIVPDGVTLPDGTAVTIAVNDEQEREVELTSAELAELDDAIVEAGRSESISSVVVLAELDRIAHVAR
jgi:hypothetical protein